MSWKTMSGPLRADPTLQTNLPENKTNFDEFRTPRPVGSRSRTRTGGGLRQENIVSEGSSNVSNRIVFDGLDSTKREILVKDTLPIKPFNVTSGNAKTSKSDAVPTAHVTPSLASRHRPSTPQFEKPSGGSSWVDAGMRRAGSFDRLRVAVEPGSGRTEIDRWLALGRRNSTGLAHSNNELHIMNTDIDNTILDQSQRQSGQENHDGGSSRKDHFGQNDLMVKDNRISQKNIVSDDNVKPLVKDRSPREETYSNKYYTQPNLDSYYNRKDIHRAGTYTTALPVERESNRQYRTEPSSTVYDTYIPDYKYVSVTSSIATDPFPSDITHWQQKHQEQLRRQLLEASQTVYGVSSTYSQPSLSNNLLRDPHEMDAIKKAADNIIKEKDMIIEKQKMRILDLERHSNETEVEIHKKLLRKSEGKNDTLSDKILDVETCNNLKELQYENGTLKAQLVAQANSANSVCHLEKNLGQREFEYQELKALMNKETELKNTQIKQLQEKLAGQDNSILELKDQLSRTKKERDDLQKQVQSFERYLLDLPSQDETNMRSSQFKSLKDENSRQRGQIAELQKRLLDASKGIGSRDDLIESLEQSDHDLRLQIDELNSEKTKLKQQLHKLRNGDDNFAGDLEELKVQNDRLKSEYEKAKRLLGAKQKKLYQQDSKHKSAIQKLEERLQREEQSVVALKVELSDKEHSLVKLKQSSKQVGEDHQNQLSSNMLLQDRIRELESRHSSEAMTLELSLVKEMGICLTDLHSLVQICLQTADGQDPNISMLLGASAPSSEEPPTADQGAVNVQSLKHRLKTVRELRKEVDRLRDIMSNKYAEDMGQNLNCTTQ